LNLLANIDGRFAITRLKRQISRYFPAKLASGTGQNHPSCDFENIGAWQPRPDADKIAPVVAVPTTARTGSAVGRADGVLPSRSRSV
jgi:hypothetical protein